MLGYWLILDTSSAQANRRNMMALEPGDVVQLKSGGPLMTVVAVEKSDVRCIWHSASAEALCSALIPAAALDHIDLADDEDLEDEEGED
jgi:uncharacterized protein YodC (DUF2158 family)